MIQGKVQLKESLKQQEISAFRDYQQLMDMDEQRRLAEKNEREQRIKMIINRTSTVTVEN